MSPYDDFDVIAGQVHIPVFDNIPTHICHSLQEQHCSLFLGEVLGFDRACGLYLLLKLILPAA